MPEPVKRRIGNTDLVVLQGDITEQATDAIVNAANSGLRGGGGVDGAIHRAAGPVIDDECREYVRKHGKLPPGKAMWTHAGKLPAKYVIHTVGPIYRNDEVSAPVLASAYRESLLLAEKLGLESVSFPAISTGVYGYPVEKAAAVAVRAIVEHLRPGSPLKLVQLVCFTDAAFAAFQKAVEAICGNAH